MPSLESTNTLADYRWLTSPAAERYFALAGDAALSELQRSDRLRRELSAERARLVLEQVALRGRARGKFSAAERMFFTPVALEQATDEQVARYKARRFVGGELALDLCCGIGGDLLALAERRPALGVDRDPIKALLAAANLRACRGDSQSHGLGSHGAGRFARLVVCGDATRLAMPADVAWHIDPDRRAGGARTSDARHYAPSLDELGAMLAGAPHAAIKLAPAAVAPDDWAERGELEWIGRGGECRQQVAWLGRLAMEPGLRRATVVRGCAGDAHSIVGRADVPCEIAPMLGRYLHEPDAAVLAAHLAGALAANCGLRAIDAGSAYFTSDELGDQSLGHTSGNALLASFEIEDVLPLDLRRVRQHLHARGIGRLEIKKRGVEHDPAAVRRQLALKGDGAAVLFLTRVAGRGLAIVAQRVTASA